MGLLLGGAVGPRQPTFIRTLSVLLNCGKSRWFICLRDPRLLFAGVRLRRPVVQGQRTIKVAILVDALASALRRGCRAC